MKEIRQRLKLKYLLFILVSIFLLLCSAYILLKPLVSDTASISIIFFILGLSLFCICFIVYYLLKKQNDNLLEDVEELHEHILDISNKDYTTNINIKHYSEFLEISLLLKNVIKRLYK